MVAPVQPHDIGGGDGGEGGALPDFLSLLSSFPCSSADHEFEWDWVSNLHAECMYARNIKNDDDNLSLSLVVLASEDLNYRTKMTAITLLTHHADRTDRTDPVP